MNLPNSISGRLVQVASALVLLTVGCGGSMDDTPVTFTEIKPLIRTSCALSSSCHGASSTYSGSLSLADTDAYCSLVGATKGATYRSTAQAQYPHRVVAGDKASSFPLSEADPCPDRQRGVEAPWYGDAAEPAARRREHRSVRAVD